MELCAPYIDTKGTSGRRPLRDRNELVSHYDITRWTDYVRGLVDAQEHSEMTRHLSECSSCRATHDLFARVAVRMKADLQYEIPEYVIRNARAIFATSAPAKRTLLQKLTGEPGIRQLPATRFGRSSLRHSRHAPRAVRSRGLLGGYSAGRGAGLDSGEYGWPTGSPLAYQRTRSTEFRSC